MNGISLPAVKNSYLVQYQNCDIDSGTATQRLISDSSVL